MCMCCCSCNVRVGLDEGDLQSQQVPRGINRKPTQSTIIILTAVEPATWMHILLVWTASLGHDWAIKMHYDFPGKAHFLTPLHFTSIKKVLMLFKSLPWSESSRRTGCFSLPISSVHAQKGSTTASLPNLCIQTVVCTEAGRIRAGCLSLKGALILLPVCRLEASAFFFFSFWRFYSISSLSPGM